MAAKKSTAQNKLRQQYREILSKQDEEYKRIAESQRKWVRGLAQRIEEEERPEFKEWDRKVIAGILRLWADNLKDAKPKPKGKPAEFDHVGLAWTYWKLRLHNKLSDTKAKERLAELYEIDDRHVARIVKEHAPGIEGFIKMGTVIWKDSDD